MKLRFDHPPAVPRFWRDLLRPLLGRQPTPFYLFSLTPVQEALAELKTHFGHLPVRHWLSCKTQPLRPLLQWWRRQGLGLEVVSEFEFLAALEAGFPPELILLNGPAKHHWLPRHPVRGLFVNFDSPAEARALLPLAEKLDWTLGVRLNTRQEFDPETSQYPTQFGMVAEEIVTTLKASKRYKVRLETVHFHLRTNVASAALYERALKEAAEICHAAHFAPKYVDCGGGFPPAHVLTRDGGRVDASFDLTAMARVYERALKLFPQAQEIWLENGRWLTARSGVLVVKILDMKERRGMRHLICDGGRTMNALVANWESHELLWLPASPSLNLVAADVSPLTSESGIWNPESEIERAHPPRENHSPGDEFRESPSLAGCVLTTVTGPTCMAFDQLARCPLPRNMRPGDHLVWLEAGAYHLPWETRFSHGLAVVLWHDGRRVKVVRPREDFAHWWGQWR